MTTIKEYTDAIEVVEEEIHEKITYKLKSVQKSPEGKIVKAFLEKLIKHLKANRWEIVKQLAKPVNEK